MDTSIAIEQNNDEPIKTIRIRTMIPFSFPFSSKKINLKIDNNVIYVDFETVKETKL